MQHTRNRGGEKRCDAMYSFGLALRSKDDWVNSIALDQLLTQLVYLCMLGILYVLFIVH